MAHLQRQFNQFHEAIRWDQEQVNLRERRERILNALRERLRRHCEDSDKPIPRFEHFNQGSYAMNTGVKPLDGDHDIDVGLRFHVAMDSGDYEDPVALKGLVHEMLEHHTADVHLKRPCVTVNYAGSYHVDLAIYASAESNGGTDYLARGFKGSSEDNKEWQPSDPRAFIQHVNEYRPEACQRDQFRRIVRYLKRWKDHRFSSNGNAAPVGIGLTISALEHLRPRFDSFDNSTPRDLKALRDLVGAMRSQFRQVFHNGEYSRRISGMMPVVPRDDVYARMSNRQMEQFETRLNELLEACSRALGEPSPHEAAKLLRPHLGDDFPVPEPDDDALRTDVSAIITTSTSA